MQADTIPTHVKCEGERVTEETGVSFDSLDELCVSIIVSFLNPMEANQVEYVDKFLKEMVGRGWTEKKYFSSVKHLTYWTRYDLSDKEYAITAWNAVSRRLCGTDTDSSSEGSGGIGHLICLGGERESSSPLNTTFTFRDSPNAELIDYNSPLFDNKFPSEWSAVAATTDSYGRIRTFGGFNGRSSVSQCCVSPGAKDIRQADQKFKWKRKGRLPKACCFASACTTHDGHILVTGGGSTLFQGASVSSDVLLQVNSSYDLDVEFRKVASLHSLRCGHSSAALPSGKLIVTGGYAGGMDYMSSAECYDTVNDSWVPISPMNVARSGFGFGVSSNGAAYAFGGSSNGSNGHDTVEMYDERVGKWELLPQKMKSGRGYMGGCVGGGMGCLYAAGGVREYITQSSVECMDPRMNTWSYMHSIDELSQDPTEDTYENFHFGRTNFTMIYSMS